ncbi:hypothetical protein J2Z19_005313 [Ensifer adhaerens]|uniref:Uncharacterized protein n=1 Tax=Ensifer adhaerens TaxID=106592 RepID=A0ACC5T382_ENSAD|nr:hypothetical protein [Ensifer adhaerens]
MDLPTSQHRFAGSAFDDHAGGLGADQCAWRLDCRQGGIACRTEAEIDKPHDGKTLGDLDVHALAFKQDAQRKMVVRAGDSVDFRKASHGFL